MTGCRSHVKATVSGLDVTGGGPPFFVFLAGCGPVNVVDQVASHGEARARLGERIGLARRVR